MITIHLKSLPKKRFEITKLENAIEVQAALWGRYVTVGDVITEREAHWLCDDRYTREHHVIVT
jgi:hypothetical protein